MSLPLNWMVLLFFLFNVTVLIIIFTLNSKFRLRMSVKALEEKIEKLNYKLSTSPDLKADFIEAIKEIREKISERQFEIFILTVEGFSSKEIAEKINRSPNTIDSSIKEICKTLEVKKRSQLGAIIFNKLKVKSVKNHL